MWHFRSWHEVQTCNCSALVLQVHWKIPTFNCFPVDQKSPLCDWCDLPAACASLREEWTTAIQTVAESLQKQEEEMMDSSPDPMDMEVCLTKIRHKVVWTIYILLLFSAATLVGWECPYHRTQTSALFLCTLTISLSSHWSRAARFALRTLPSSLDFPNISRGWLSTR